MKTFLTTLRMRQWQLYLLVMAAFLVYWTCMLVTDPKPGRLLPAASTVLVIPAICVMFWVARAQSAQLARALAMLGNLQSPHSVRRVLIRSTSFRVAASWAFLAAGIGVQFWRTGSAYAPLTGAALVSLSACLGLLRGLPGTRGKVMLGWLLGAAPWLAAVTLLITGVGGLLARLDGLPPLLLFGCVLLLPAVLLGTQVQCERALQSFRSQQMRRNVLRIWLAAQLRRWTVLGWDHGALPVPASTTALLTQRVLQIGVPLALLAARPEVNGGVVDLPRIGDMAIGAAVISCSLLMRDLHLKQLLVPSGLRRGRIASRIFGFTFGAQLLLILAGYVVVSACLLGRGTSPVLLLAKLLGSWPHILELGLMTSGALVLAGFIGPARISLVAGLYLVCQIISPSIGGPMLEPLAPFPYAVCMVAASGVLLLLANRLWTTRLLFGRNDHHWQLRSLA